LRNLSSKSKAELLRSTRKKGKKKLSRKKGGGVKKGDQKSLRKAADAVSGHQKKEKDQHTGYPQLRGTFQKDRNKKSFF